MEQFRTQGYAKNEDEEILHFDPNPQRCGKIDDGVALRHEGELGAWVISYEALMKMANLAKQARENNPIPWKKRPRKNPTARSSMEPSHG